MNDIIEHYVDQHTAASAALAGARLPWLAEQRQSSIERFRESGFPTQRDEDWRYTPLKQITSKLFEVKVAADATPTEVNVTDYLIKDLDSYQLVFIDGKFVPAHSNFTTKNDKIIVASLEQYLSKDPGQVPSTLREQRPLSHGFAALNIAFSKDGYLIQIPANTKLDKPIEILTIAASNQSVAQPRNMIQLGQFAEACVIERFVSTDNVVALCNSTTQIILGEGVRLDHYLIQTQQNKASQVTTVDAEQEKDSVYSCRTISLGGDLIRNNLTVSLNGPGAHCDMLGLYNIAGKQHVDNHTNVIHSAPHCTSRELYKGVLDQRARAVFHGRIKVEQDAQKTDATQTNNNILLSSNAEVDTKPQLEIYADDVKCAHGATVGQIDETALFYLRSRGIDEQSARSLLTFAFVNDVLEEIDVAPLRGALERQLAQSLIDEQ